jgi:hypothetical protein
VAVRGQAEEICTEGLPRRALGQPQHDLVGLVVESPDRVRPDDLLGRDGKRIGVAGHGRSEQPCRVGLLAQFRAGEDRRVVVGKETLDAGEQVHRVGVRQSLRIAVADHGCSPSVPTLPAR